MNREGQEKGLIHIYYGNGKGKTTASMGLVLRAAGAGKKILIYQFMKDNKSSEREILKTIDHVKLYEGLALEKFSFQMSEKEKEERYLFYTKKFHEIIEEANQYDVLLLDEILYTIRAGLFPQMELENFLKTKPEGLEVILTGNEPDQKLIEMADYVSCIQKIKHPYDQGIGARKGIEK